MNKQKFMMILKDQLKGIPEKDKRDILFDYETHFEIGLNKGRNEEEIALSLGNPKTIAKEFKADYMITQVENSFTMTNFFRAFFATIGLGFFNLIFVLGPFIAIFAALFSILVSGFAIVLSGIFVMFAPLFSYYFQNVPSPVACIFIGICVISFGLLWLIASFYLTKYFYLLTVKYLKFNLKIIVKRRNKND